MMKNILVAIDCINEDGSTIELSCYLAKLTDSDLTGIFVDETLYPEVPEMKIAFGMPYVETILASDLPDFESKQLRQNNIRQLFELSCSVNNIDLNIGDDNPISLADLVYESRFTDLLVVNVKNSSQTAVSDRIPESVQNILSKAECPVILGSTEFNVIDEILFAYDGKASCVYAIKQFSYLFPEMRHTKLTLIQVEENDPQPSNTYEMLNRLLSRHYSNVAFCFLKGDLVQELTALIKNKKSALVIMGSFGRGRLSRLLIPSTAERLLEKISLPLFIAHL